MRDRFDIFLDNRKRPRRCAVRDMEQKGNEVTPLIRTPLTG